MGFPKFRTEKAASTLHSSDTERAEQVDNPQLDLDVESKALEGAVSTGDPATETATSPADPDIPPDGGLEAWLQVLGSAAILVATWGLINSFGVFQAFYETTLLKDRSPSDISWIGSIQAALLLFTGVVSGPLYDAGHFRLLVRVGLLMIVFGMFMTSLCTEYYQFLLAQGFCVGLGMGIIFLPSAAILSQYFLRHRALVLGLASAGSPIAGIVFPVIFSNLEPRIGFGWTTRIMAFIILALSVVPIVFMHTRLPPTQGRKRAMFDATAFRDLPYVIFAAAGFFSFLTLYVPFFYLVLWAHTHHVSSPKWAPYLVTFLNAGSFFGRIIPNALADRYGALNVMCVCMIASSAIGYAWGTYYSCLFTPPFLHPGHAWGSLSSWLPRRKEGRKQVFEYGKPLLTDILYAVTNLGGAIVFALLYGAFSGGVVSLTPTVLVALSPEPSRVGARMGMGFLVTGLSLLIGTPIAGAIVRGYTEPRWQGVKAYSATGLLVSTFLYMLSRYFVYQRRGHHWKF